MIKEKTSKNTIDTIVDLILKTNPKRILDIPCGSGALSKKLKSKNIEVISADIENVIETNQDNFIQADMNKKFSFEDKSFDAVISVDGIEHIRRQFDFIYESKRILKKRGVLIISTPNISAIRSRWRYFITGFHNKCKTPLDEKNPNYLHHISMISFPELRYMLHTNGFQIKSIKSNRYKLISIFYLPFIPFLMLFTYFSFKKELKSRDEKTIGNQIFKQMFLPSLLFGETTIITAVRQT